MADYPNLTGKLKGRMDEAVSDPLGKDVSDPDSQPQGVPARPPVERVHKLSPQRKNFFSVAKDNVTRFRQSQPPAGTGEKFFSKLFLQA